VRLLALALLLAAAPTGAWTQQPNTPPIVGLMSFAAFSDDPAYEAFRGALRDLGYMEGRSVRIEFRTAQGHADRLPTLAEELVQLKADVIVVGNTPAARAVKRATSTIPIVIVSTDPVASGLVTNLARPGGNLTGLSTMTTELSAKRLQLLKETVPQLARVAVLWNPTTPLAPFQSKVIEDLKAAAPSMSIELKIVTVQAPEEFNTAFKDISRAQVQALYLVESPLFYGHRKTLAALALQARLPAIYGTKAYANDGGLMSYGPSNPDLFRRAATYVDKILKGARPADLPVEQPTKFELVINLKTAKALGLTIPPSLLQRADQVIE
jgi:putative ABC transport system substrate-binding protein